MAFAVSTQLQICALAVAPLGVSLNNHALRPYLQDRPGHDLHYVVDASKIQRELGWAPEETCESGMRKTVQWYLDDPEWVAHVNNGTYQ